MGLHPLLTPGDLLLPRLDTYFTFRANALGLAIANPADVQQLAGEHTPILVAIAIAVLFLAPALTSAAAQT